MLSHTRLKVCVVVAAVCWFALLIYVLSSLRGQPGGPANSTKHIDSLRQAGNIALARVAKSQALVSEFLQHAWKGNVSHSHSQSSNRHGPSSRHTSVKVVVSGDADSLLGVMAMMNSVATNTHHPLHFHVTLPSAVMPHFNKWISQTKLRTAGLTVKPHPLKVPQKRPHYAKIYIKNIFPNLKGSFVYLDPDVIVQGDISELLSTPIINSQFGAFTKDCFSTSKHLSLTHHYYSSHLNLLHPAIRALKIHPNTCVPNTGVFVSEMHLWANASHQMQDLISTSTVNDPIHSSMADEGEAAMLAVMHGHMAPLPRVWHLPDLGLKARVSYSKHFVQSAKLLHWNGHFKPWSRKAAFSDIWLRYYLADPSGKYRPARISP